ncbi:MAG: ribosomal protein L7/L12 [Planctomycetes bacterium]|nr:ribosomal protein L7/L12 [Planctomycetota bacterium]
MSDPISDDELDAVRAQLLAGRKIEAIKLYRQASGAGLAEAKRFVELWETDPQAAGRPTGSFSDADIAEIQAAIFAGQKIPAIKLYRKASGQGLKEAKDFVEALEAELRRTDPTKFTAPAAKGCSISVFCVILLLGTLMAITHVASMATASAP